MAFTLSDLRVGKNLSLMMACKRVTQEKICVIQNFFKLRVDMLALLSKIYDPFN